MRSRRWGVLHSGTPRPSFFEPAYSASPRSQSAPINVPEDIALPEITAEKPKEPKKEEGIILDTPQKNTSFSPIRGKE